MSKRICEDIAIVPMRREHWEAVRTIYVEGIATGNATFETSPPEWETFDAAHHQFGRLVAFIEGHLVGWATLAPVSKRNVYSGVAEVSVYVAEQGRAKGCGRLLLQTLITESEQNDIWTLQAGI